MLSPAARAALQMIANERVLHDETLLDAIGRPVRLTKSSRPDVANLRALSESVLALLPPDLAALFLPLSDHDAADDKVVQMSGGLRVVAAFLEWVGPAGETWVAAIVGATVPMGADEVHLPMSALDEVVNRLNWSSDSCAWSSNTVDDMTFLLRVSGSAAPLDSRLESWRHVVAHLIVDALAAAENYYGDDAAAQPASNYLKLLTLAHGPESSAFGTQELLTAAQSFRDSLASDLAQVVDVQPTETGVLVTVPFRAGSTTYPLSVVFAPTAPCPENPQTAAGLAFMSRCYALVPAESAMKWARTFNGDDMTSDTDDRWDQTTPWLTGSWRSLEGPEPEKMVVYRGFVPNALKAHVSLTDLIAGTVREVWVSCDKYRLRERFNETVGVDHGTI